MKTLCIALALTGLAVLAHAEEKQVGKKSEKKVETKTEKKSDKYENLALFQKVLFFIEQNYVEEVSSKDLIYGAIKGMMDTLDPHSNFLTPEIFKSMKNDTSGKFGGVGLEVGLKDNIITVVTPIDDTPAFRAGIRSGDKVLKIDGDSTKGMSLADAVAKMRGKKGTEIKFSVWREGFDAPKEFNLMREEIKIATVKNEELEPGYHYIRLTNFNENSAAEMRSALEKAEKKSGVKGLVFDLRNNPGGLLEQAVDISSLFVDEGIIVSTIGRDKDNRDVRYAKKGMSRKDFQLAVLVNGSSASASEIVAGALQDHKRAVIMGQPTFGKGSVQSVVELQPEIGLKLTIAKYYTPKGRSIQLRGIQPDVILDELDQSVIQAATKKSAGIREKDLKRRFDYEGEEPTDYLPIEYSNADEKNAPADSKNKTRPFVAREDYQVKEALNYIKSYQMFRAAEILEPSQTKVAAPTLPKEKETN